MTDWGKKYPGAKPNVVKSLIDGKEFFAELARMIRTATAEGHFIYITGWMLDIEFPLIPGDKDSTFKKLILNAIEKKVEIRILIWDSPMPDYYVMNRQKVLSLHKAPYCAVFLDRYNYTPEKVKDFIRKLKDIILPKLEKYKHFIFDPKANFQKWTGIEPDVAWKIAEREMNKPNVAAHHEKLIIVRGSEGLIATCGGMDINKNRFTYYHDLQCFVHGPAVLEILEKFKKRWNNNHEAKNIALSEANETDAQLPFGQHFDLTKLERAFTIGTFNSYDGKLTDRSFKKEYLKILKAAKHYIYIEDQYMINPWVAEVLNKKVVEPGFKKLVILIQDDGEASDLLIPMRARFNFFSKMKDALQHYNKKIFIYMPDKKLTENPDAKAIAALNKKMGTNYDSSPIFHPGVHAKTLIVDDTLAIIGSGNVNNRSFTLDSETSVVIFNPKTGKHQDNFGYQLRQNLWKEFISPFHKHKYFRPIGWDDFHKIVESGETFLTNYQHDETVDKDYKIWRFVNSVEPIAVFLKPIVAPNASWQQFLTYTSSNDNPYSKHFDLIYKYIVDPDIDNMKP